MVKIGQWDGAYWSDVLPEPEKSQYDVLVSRLIASRDIEEQIILAKELFNFAHKIGYGRGMDGCYD